MKEQVSLYNYNIIFWRDSMRGEQLLSDATNLPKQLKKKQVSLLPSDSNIIIAIWTGKYDFSFVL